MAVTKLSLYNNALILLGQRILASDTEDRPNRHKLDALYNNGAVDYCLEMVKPRFAVKLVSLTGVTPTLITGYTKEASLPSSFQALVGVFADASLDQEITRFTHEDDKILSDVSTIFVRYVRDFATVGLTNMSHSFGNLVSAYLARELAVTVDPDTYETLVAETDKRLEISIATDSETEADNKGLKADDLTLPWYNIYNDALQLLGLPRLASITEDSLRKNQLDLARSSEMIEACLEDTAWGFASESAKMFYDPSIEPEFGPKYAFTKPADLHRLDGIWSDDSHHSPIREYSDEGGKFFTDYQTIYIEYVSKDYITDPTLWPSYFKRFVAGQLAIDAGPSIGGSNMDNAQARYDTRRAEAMSTDAIQTPPRRFAEGSWASSRNSNSRISNRNRP